MGDRGRVVHVHRLDVALLGGTGLPCAVLAANQRWTSLVPLEGDLDPAELAAATRADVVVAWFDDDAGAMLRFAGADGFAGELSVPLFDDGGAGAEDRRFIDALVRRKLLNAAAGSTLKTRLKDPPRKRDAWIARHGLEKAFGFPFTIPIPEGVDRSVILQSAPSATFVNADGGATAQPASERARAAPKQDGVDWTIPLPRRYRLPEEARPTLDLHVFYWTEVWSMNSFTLYNRYKKHLPAEDRGLVDELANAVAMGNTGEIPSRVEHILQTTWQAEDWAAFIRSSKLDDPGTDDDTARRWREMTARGEMLH